METTTGDVRERRPTDETLTRLREIVWHAREQTAAGGGRVAYEEAIHYLQAGEPLRAAEVRCALAAWHRRALDRAARLRAELDQEEGALVAYARLSDSLERLMAESGRGSHAASAAAVGGGTEPC